MQLMICHVWSSPTGRFGFLFHLCQPRRDPDIRGLTVSWDRENDEFYLGACPDESLETARRWERDEGGTVPVWSFCVTKRSSWSCFAIRHRDASWILRILDIGPRSNRRLIKDLPASLGRRAALRTAVLRFALSSLQNKEDRYFL